MQDKDSVSARGPVQGPAEGRDSLADLRAVLDAFEGAFRKAKETADLLTVRRIMRS